MNWHKVQVSCALHIGNLTDMVVILLRGQLVFHYTYKVYGAPMIPAHVVSYVQPPPQKI